MKKALLPLVIASIVPSAAFADVIVYGKAWLAFENTDVKNFTPGVSGTFTDIRNNESRLGVKGSEEISDGLKAIYQYELKIGADDGKLNDKCDATSTSVTTVPAATTKTTTTCKIDGNPFSQRNTFIGLQGNFGTVKAGMFDTPLKLAQEKTDVFKDMTGDWKNVFQGETRAKNIIQYSTPAFFHITYNNAYVSSEQGYENTAKNGYTHSLVYDTKAIYVALAADHNVSIANSAQTFAPTPRLDTDIVRLVGRFLLGPVVLGVMYETYDNGVANSNGNETLDGKMVSAIYNITDKWAVKGQYGTSDMVDTGKVAGGNSAVKQSGNTASIGADYKMSKSTKLTGYFTTLKDDGFNTATKLYDTKLEHDDKWVGLAMEFSF